MGKEFDLDEALNKAIAEISDEMVKAKAYEGHDSIPEDEASKEEDRNSNGSFGKKKAVIKADEDNSQKKDRDDLSGKESPKADAKDLSSGSKASVKEMQKADEDNSKKKDRDDIARDEHGEKMDGKGDKVGSSVSKSVMNIRKSKLIEIMKAMDEEAAMELLGEKEEEGREEDMEDEDMEKMKKKKKMKKAEDEKEDEDKMSKMHEDEKEYKDKMSKMHEDDKEEKDEYKDMKKMKKSYDPQYMQFMENTISVVKSMAKQIEELSSQPVAKSNKGLNGATPIEKEFATNEDLRKSLPSLRELITAAGELAKSDPAFSDIHVMELEATGSLSNEVAKGLVIDKAFEMKGLK